MGSTAGPNVIMGVCLKKVHDQLMVTAGQGCGRRGRGTRGRRTKGRNRPMKLGILRSTAAGAQPRREPQQLRRVTAGSREIRRSRLPRVGRADGRLPEATEDLATDGSRAQARTGDEPNLSPTSSAAPTTTAIRLPPARGSGRSTCSGLVAWRARSQEFQMVWSGRPIRSPLRRRTWRSVLPRRRRRRRRRRHRSRGNDSRWAPSVGGEVQIALPVRATIARSLEEVEHRVDEPGSPPGPAGLATVLPARLDPVDLVLDARPVLRLPQVTVEGSTHSPDELRCPIESGFSEPNGVRGVLPSGLRRRIFPRPQDRRVLGASASCASPGDVSMRRRRRPGLRRCDIRARSGHVQQRLGWGPRRRRPRCAPAGSGARPAPRSRRRSTAGWRTRGRAPPKSPCSLEDGTSIWARARRVSPWRITRCSRCPSPRRDPSVRCEGHVRRERILASGSNFLSARAVACGAHAMPRTSSST